jgi:lysophospholipase
MKAAPYHTELADAPAQTHAVWAQASDGVRARVAITPVEGATGPVLVFPGRTEIVEKYGRVAGRLAAAGWASASIDWRGQGLADRLIDDPLIGHVGRFSDYQRDVAALLEVVKHTLPGPYMLIGHSMGGAIGLHAVLDGINVNAAAFSAPMWGIAMPALQKPINEALTFVLDTFGQGQMRAPTTSVRGYLLENTFEDNNLTNDQGAWDYMVRQVVDVPGLRLAGPSVHWVREAVAECRALLRHAPRDLPVLTGFGSAESIVSKTAIRQRMALWPKGELLEIAGARHELMMETPERREVFEGQMMRLFEGSL